MSNNLQLDNFKTYLLLSTNNGDNNQIGIDNLVSIEFKHSIAEPEETTKCAKTIYYIPPRVSKLILTASLVKSEDVGDSSNNNSNSTANNTSTDAKIDIDVDFVLRTSRWLEMDVLDKIQHSNSEAEKEDSRDSDDEEESFWMKPPIPKKRKTKELHEEIRQKLVNKILNTVLGKQNEYYCTNVQLHAFLSSLFEEASFKESDNVSAKKIQYWKRKFDWSNKAVIPNIDAEFDKENNIIITLTDLPLEVSNILLSSFTLNFEGMTSWLQHQNLLSKTPSFLYFANTTAKRKAFIHNSLNGNSKSLLYLQPDPDKPTCKYKLYIDDNKHTNLISVPWIMYLIRSHTATSYGHLELALSTHDVTEAANAASEWKNSMQFPSLPINWNDWKIWYNSKVKPQFTNSNDITEQDTYIKKRILSQIGKRICWSVFLLESARIYSIHNSNPVIYSKIEASQNNINKRIESICQDCTIVNSGTYPEKKNVGKPMDRNHQLLSLFDSINYLQRKSIFKWFDDADTIRYNVQQSGHILTDSHLDTTVLFDNFDRHATKKSYSSSTGQNKWLSKSKLAASTTNTKKNLIATVNQVMNKSVSEIEKSLETEDKNKSDSNSNTVTTNNTSSMNISKFFKTQFL